MLGRIRWGDERTAVLYREILLGLPVLTVQLPQCARGPERALKKGGALLRGNGVRRVLTPPDFSRWELLRSVGLRPVDTAPLRYALAPGWVTAQLARRNIPPEQAVLRLSGAERESVPEPPVRALCPLVRSLVLDFPGGEAAADRLRRVLGMPVLPGDFSGVHLTLCLKDGPVLSGAKITAPGRELPPDCDRLALLSVLWETGRVKTEEIALEIALEI